MKRKLNLLATVKKFLLVMSGTVILSFGVAVFIIPFNIVVGGVSGVAIILDKLLPYEFITVDRLIFILTWSLFTMGLFVLGKDFAVKTFLSTLIYPIGISAFSHLASNEVFGGFFSLTNTQHSQSAVILAALFGGLLIGTGCSLAFVGGGSTGGMDVLAFIICKVFKKLKSSRVIFILDTLTILLGMVVLADLSLTLLGIIAAFIGATVIDKIFVGGSKAFVAQIISDEHEKICSEIIEKLGRTATVTQAIGAYSKQPKKVITVSFTATQYADLLSVVAKLDRNAFVTVHRAHEISGRGWTI